MGAGLRFFYNILKKKSLTNVAVNLYYICSFRIHLTGLQDTKQKGFIGSKESKMIRKGIIALLLVGIISFSSCKKGVNNSTSGDVVQDYFPLHVGNTWTYVYDVGGQEKEETYSIVETRKIGEYEYFVFDKCPLPFFPADYEKGAETIVRKTEHGDVVLRFIDEDIMYYKFSDTTLDSMRAIDAVSTQFITYLESVEDTVATSAGTFVRCYRFLAHVAQIKDSVIRVWFAPQVGPVRFQYLGGGTTDFLLKSAVVAGRDY
mgnify:CR=1 FL=1